jgi:hypothetical protein
VAILPIHAEPLPLPDKPVFPPRDAWNKDISKEPVDPASDAILRTIGLDKPLHPDFGSPADGWTGGIPYIVVSGTQPKIPVAFDYADESDPGPYPIPEHAPIEGGPGGKGDRHILVIDRDNWILYELFSSFPPDGKRGWRAGSGAIFDLTSPKPRPLGWTSADAAGLPIFPGLVRYDEAVVKGLIPHALRFTCVRTRHAYVAPATHFASRLLDDDLPPMGARVRLKSDFDISGFPKCVQPILICLKTYGMILADNGSDLFISGSPDPRWNNEELHALKKVKGSDLEIVKMGVVSTK